MSIIYYLILCQTFATNQSLLLLRCLPLFTSVTSCTMRNICHSLLIKTGLSTMKSVWFLTLIVL